MAEDWAKLFIKFSAANKSLESEFAKYNLGDTEDRWKAIEATDKLMEGHEKKLGAAAIAAYEAGVTSKKLAEFMKDKGFADAKKLLDSDRKNLVAELKLLEAQCDKCKATATKAYALAQEMSKSIMADKTKDKNPDREKVKKLREGLMAAFAELTEASNMRFKPPKYLTAFDGQYDKLIDHLIADALKKGKDPEEQLEVPQPLTDKHLGVLVKESARLAEVVLDNITKKFELPPDDQQASAHVKKADSAITKLEKLVAESTALKKKFKDAIAGLKERSEILKQFKTIEENLAKSLKIIKDGPPAAKKVK